MFDVNMKSCFFPRTVLSAYLMKNGLFFCYDCSRIEILKIHFKSYGSNFDVTSILKQDKSL